MITIVINIPPSILNKSVTFKSQTIVQNVEERIRTIYSIQGGGIFQANDILADPNATIGELDQPIIFKDGVFTMESKEGTVDSLNKIVNILAESIKNVAIIKTHVDFYSETSSSAPLHDASYAEEVLARMNMTLDLIVDYSFDDDENRFIDYDIAIQNLVNQEYGDEYFLNANIFPIFQNIFNDEFGFDKNQYSKCIYNSEMYHWLPEDNNSKHNNKPDGFISYKYFSEEKPTPENIISANKSIRYGVPNNNCISLIHGILEAKTGFGPIALSELGRLFKYLFLLTKCGHQSPRGVLYNQTNIIFAQFDERGNCIRLNKRQWSQLGCCRCLQQFFSNGCNPIADDIIDHFYNQHYFVQSVLGKGKYGLVFKIKKDQKEFAVKCVKKDSKCFREEYERLLELQSTRLFIGVVEGSLILSNKINSYLMCEIGTPVDINNKKIKNNVVNRLHQLHVKGITHGDPRIPNIVICDRGVLKWIDVRYNYKNDEFGNDVITLWQNINKKDFDQSKMLLLDSYCRNKDLETLQSIFSDK